jgi:CheY-like chemotaxis protein
LRVLRQTAAAPSVHVVRDGVEAIDFMLAQGAHAERSLDDMPRLVLLDLKLPRLDGLEVLTRLKQHEPTRHVPVVMVTTSSEEKDVTASYRLGVNSYVVKSVNFDEFSRALQTVASYWLELNRLPQRRLRS